MPKILPEHLPPEDLTEKERRNLTEHTTSRLVWGEGNPLAPIFIILDNPGARENTQGQSFLCASRDTLLQGAMHASLALEDLYVTYLLKARPLRKYDKEKARAFSEKYLFEQVKNHQPAVVFCLGNVVVQTYFQDPKAEVKHLREKTHLVRGIPTVVSYHPLAVRRRPNLRFIFNKDWALVRSLLSR